MVSPSTAATGSGLLSKVSRILGSKLPGAKASEGIDRATLQSGVNAFKALIPSGRHWTTTEFAVGPDEANLRLDRLITSRYDVPRPLLQKLLRKGMIKLERPDYVQQPGKIAEASQIVPLPVMSGAMRVQSGDVVSLSEVFLQERRTPSQLKLEEITEDRAKELHDLILYRDDDIIVLNKPAGLAVHGGEGMEGQEHIDRFLAAFKFEKSEVPRLVHRLDKDTSGLLLLARSRQAASNLATRFQGAKGLKKFYWAMVNGLPPLKQGRIATNIYQSDKGRQTSIADNRIDVLDDGKVAITRFRTAGVYIRKEGSKRKKLALLELEPITGRTHQLRVHMSEQLGTPILGDYKYARHHLTRAPLHLHARKLELEDYPEPGKTMSFTAPLPEHWVQTMTRFPLFLRKKPVFPKKKLHNRPNNMKK